MAAPMPRRERVMTTEELCEWLDIGLTTARDWRRDGNGPPWVQKGPFVRYLESDVMAWLKAHRRESSAA